MFLGEKKNKNFETLSRDLEIAKHDSDKILKDLENERYINQWIVSESDGFRIEVLQKGFDTLANMTV